MAPKVGSGAALALGLLAVLLLGLGVYPSPLIDFIESGVSALR
jgi:NADH:ubiquinone oxidoreductase subunit 4 (subunit M)